MTEVIVKRIKHEHHKRIDRLVTKSQLYDILKRDMYKCRKCGNSPATNPKVILHVDHIKPRSKGGRTIPGNLQILCSTCNLEKGISD